jgi:hypothetical protein
MRYLLRIITLIIIMTLTTATASADKYSRAWEKVEKLIEEDQPESAAKIINQIWDMAANDNDGRQMLKSAVYLTQVQQTYTENSLTNGIELFSSLLNTLKVQEHKALCHAFLAKGYISYWQANRYNMIYRLPSDDPNPSLDNWTPKMICDTICYHLDQSINLAGNVGSGFYQEFFPGGNKAGQKLRPLLADMLMDHAIMPISSYDLTFSKRKFFDDKRLYGTMSEFLEATRQVKADDPDLWQIYVLRRLVNHNIASKPNIRCTVDIRRMQVLAEYLNSDNEWNRNEEEWLKGTVALAEQYTKKVKFSTMFYSMAVNQILDYSYMLPEDEQANLLRQAHDICIAAQRKWPKSEGALECASFRAELEQRDVSFAIDQDFLPGERNIARLDYKNVSTVYIKVVEVPGKIKEYAQVDLLAQLNQCNAVAEWSMHVNDPRDYMDHFTMINIPPVMQGSYYMMVSSGPYFGSGDCIAYKYIECNGIQFVRLIERNGTLHGVAVNTRTGQPVPDCKYTLWRCNYDGDAVQVATSGITPADGTIMLEGYSNGTFKIELEKGADRGNDSFSLPYRSDMPDMRYLRLFTDRYTYLPGDSIQFTGVLYFKRGDNADVTPDTEINVYVRGSRKEEFIGTFTTDEMGVIKGSYKIPDNYLPGSLSIRAEVDRNLGYYIGSKSVNVESFRQPKFKVDLDLNNKEVTYDQTITVTGNTQSFTGVPVDSASVEWYAGIDNWCCHLFCVPDELGYVRVGAGNVKTGPDGTFSFEFTVPGDMMVEERSTVFVNAKVTDLNGESHEAGLQFTALRKPSRYININTVNGIIDRNGQKTFQFTMASNIAEVAGRINVKVSRLAWLEKPGLPLPFKVNAGERMLRELNTAADNMNLKERFPLYEFDLLGNDIAENVVFEGVVPFDPDDPESRNLILDRLPSGVYRITADAPGCRSAKTDVVLCREDDYDFVSPKDLLWSYVPSYSYRTVLEVGDTARIRLGSNVKGAVIHYYVENRLGVVNRGSLVTDGRQQILSIPITDELKGYFAVNCCVLYEGVVRNKSFEFEVPDRDRQLKMELVTFRSLLEPDVDEEWKLRITDWEGNPVKAAVMLDMYDRSLDAYGSNSFYFNAFNPTYVYGSSLITPQYTYSNQVNQYLYWQHTFGNPFEYKGKRAITGILLDPFEYYNVGYRKFGSGRAIPLREASYRVQTINMEEFEELGITSVDEALQGSVAGLEIVSDSGDLGARSNRLTGMDDGEEEMLEDALFMHPSYQNQNQGEVAIRTDMNPTGLFEYIVTDSTGTATVNFRTPQLLTEWNVKGLSFTDSLKSASLDTTLITRKLIMVEPTAPRFLREGDRLEFTVKVSNLMDKAAPTTVIMTMTDAVTGRALGIIEGGTKKKITIPAGGSASTSFTVKVPSSLQAITYRLTAQTTGHSDGMEQTIPVLTNRTQVVQALSLFNNGSEKRSFHFEVLDRPRTSTMENEQLTLEYSATPIWYAIQSLPSMIRLGDISTLSFFYSMMGSAISQDLCRRYPVIREMLDEWQQLPVSEWQTQLERNQDLTGTLLEETPWVFSNRSERDRLHDLARNLGSAHTAEAFDYGLQRLIATQNYDGGWSWIPGFESSMYITKEIMHGLGQLIEGGIIEVTADIKRMVQNGIDYIDKYYYKEYNVENKPKSLGYDQLYYLLIRSYFQSYKFSGLTEASHTYFSRLADIQDTHELNLMFRAQLALLMARTGKTDQAKKVAATIADRALYDDEMGRYWRDNTGGMMWYEAPIETQSQIIRLFMAVGRQTEAVEAARWLLKQKQTTGWATSPATAAAVTALMATGGSTWLAHDPEITIYVGQEALQASTSKATAGLTTKTWTGPISRDKADITIDAKTEGISWGAIYRTFTETLDHVEAQNNGITLKRTIWRVNHSADGDRLEEVKPDTKLHVGDQLRVRFDVETDRNLEYLQLTDMRASTVEPVSTHAGFSYNWHDDIGYYAAPGNTRNVFYIYRLSKGTYVMEYDVRVQKPGHFTVGNAVMQCLYAPAFRATTPSMTITVQ